MDEHETVEQTPEIKRRKLTEFIGNLLRGKPEVIPLPVIEKQLSKPSEKGAPSGFQEIEALPLQVESMRKNLAEKISRAESRVFADEEDAVAHCGTCDDDNESAGTDNGEKEGCGGGCEHCAA